MLGVFLSDVVLQLRIVHIVELNAFRNGLLAWREQVQLLFVDVVYALEFLALVDWPRQRTYFYLEFFLYFVAQVERVVTVTVHLVDEHNHRGLTHTAHFHQFSGLCLYTLGAVNYNNYTVYSRKCSEGVFLEVLVTWGIKNVNLVAVVVECHNRGRNRNSTLLFYFHPVAGGGLLYLVALYGSGNVDGASEQQQFLGKCGFTRIGVTDYCKGASSLYFFYETHSLRGLFLFIIFCKITKY